MPATTTYPLTGNAFIDSLLGGVKWATLELTYSFPTSASYYGTNYGYGEPSDNFGVLNSVQQAAARSVFDAFSSVANTNFTEITESPSRSADLRLALSDAPSTAWAYFPATAPEGGDIWFNKSNGYYDTPQKGNYAFTTFLHETGHTLGLEHAHEGNAMPLDRDSMEYTVMSYRSYVGASTTGGYTNERWGYAQSLMMYDIAALQHMYGADYGTNAGSTTYSWSPTTGEMFINGLGQGAPGANRIFLTVWDGGGKDTYDFSKYTTSLDVDLRPGEWTMTSSAQLARLHHDGSKVAVGNIANALLHNNDPRSLIENAKGGSGNDAITGNVAANTLWGNGGDDSLFGLDGADLFFGGAGNDTLDGGAGRDMAIFNGLKRAHTISGTLDSLDISGPEGLDRALSVEVFEFVDGRQVRDVYDRAAVVYRMYDAALGRGPDSIGLNSWITSLEKGMSLDSLAANFINSSEFTKRYGDLSNREFVEQLYRNVLDREGETTGVNSWTANLDSGQLSRAQVLKGFSESPEHIKLLRPDIEQGIWDQDGRAAAVARLYDTAFDRLPDAGGLTGWTNKLKHGELKLEEIVDKFLLSKEFQTKFGNLSNKEFVEHLYRTALDRSPDASGLNSWTSALDSGKLDRGDVLLGFSESFEHQLKTQGLVDDGVMFA